MKGPSLSEQLADHLENKERHDFAKQVDREARDDSRQKINELAAALKEAKETIKIWHGPDAWEIYDQHSPEMRRLNAAIDLAEEGS